MLQRISSSRPAAMRSRGPSLAPQRNLRAAPPQAFAAAGAAASFAAGPGALLSAATLIGGLVLLQREFQDQASSNNHKAINQRPCPSCGGSGYEPCLCHKWSDGDTGCSTCSKTGYMPCRSCKGGGTAIPIKASIHAK